MESHLSKAQFISGNENRSFDNESNSSGNDADADIRPLYDSDTMSKVHHDMFKNMFVHGIQNHKQPESIPDTYVVNEKNNNIISDIPNMDPDRDKEEHDYVNREALKANSFLTKELERYKDKEKHFAKDKTIESEYCKKIKLLNDEISNLKSQAYQNDKTFAMENGKYDEYTAQTLHMLLPKEDSVHTRKQGLGFQNQNDVENPFILNKAKELPPIKDVNLQPNYFEKGIVKEMKDDLKYVTSLEDEFDEKCLILDIQQELFKTQFGSVKLESHSHVYENDIFEQNSSLENENRCLKKTITELSTQVVDVKEEMTKRCAQYEKDFTKLEARCISLKLKSQNKSSTPMQNRQVLSNKSDEDKIKFDTEDLETINIESKYSVASLLKENEHMKMIYQNLFDSIKHSRASRMLLYIRGMENGKLLVDLVLNEPFKYGTVIIPVLQGLPQDIYNLVNHHTKAKDIWDRVKLLIERSEISLQERESKLYDEFDMFTSVPGETIHTYYLRFVQLINDMNSIGMTIMPIQINTKFINHLQPE
ncbi:hypothetical protein Tco_1193781 [Tanacetum coccineum]